MNYNDNPTSRRAQSVHTSSISVDGFAEHIAILQDLIGNIACNAQDIIPKLGGSKIVNAQCKVVDVEGTNGTNKRCYLQIQTVDTQVQKSSSVSLVEITNEEFEATSKPMHKNKNKNIVDESLCRRSDRFANINKGFKDKTSDLAASSSSIIPASQPGEMKYSSKHKQKVAVILGPTFEAMIINKNAPPPPAPHIGTLQAIGTGPCKMAPHEVSSSVLNYDSSNE